MAGPMNGKKIALPWTAAAIWHSWVEGWIGTETLAI
jgi:hypothetical protein